jgi:xylulokinase
MTDRVAYLALDLGTTELKGGLVATDGTLLASGRAGYPLDADEAGRAEQDPEAWWHAVGEVVGRVTTSVRDAAVAGIAVVGQGPTMVAAGDDGRPTRRAITWLDTRSGAEAKAIEAATGLSGWELGVQPAALRVEREEPLIAARTRWYLNSWEWLTFRMTGVAATTLALGQRRGDGSLTGPLGLPREKLGPIVAVGTALGGLLPSVAADLGLRPGIPVVAGANDAYSSFFGAGLRAAGDAIDTGGTSGGLGVYWDQPCDAEGTFRAPAPIPGLWVYGGAMAATGKAVDWLREDVLGGSIDLPRLLDEVASTPPGAGGLIFLPYLAGERAPLWDPTARGAFVGLGLEHRRGHVARAVLEAAAFALRHVAAPIRDAGVAIHELRVSGASAQSRVWNQIKADILGVPIAVPAVPETALQGAAVIASVGVGDQPDLRTAMGALVRFADRFEPDPSTGPTYDAAYEAYTALHPAIAPIVRRYRALPGGDVRPSDEAWSDAPAAATPTPA